MTTITSIPGTKTSLGSLGTLANGTYVNAGTITSSNALDVIVEVNALPNGVTSGDQQIVVFAQESLDGTNFSSGPTSGTTTTDESDLYFLGTVPVNSANQQTKAFSVAAALGWVPPYLNVIVKNDCGVALTSGSVAYSLYTGSGV
jgi:hypothetical protein